METRSVNQLVKDQLRARIDRLEAEREDTLKRLRKLAQSGHHLSVRIKRYAHAGASDGDSEYSLVYEVIDQRDVLALIKEIEASRVH